MFLYICRIKTKMGVLAGSSGTHSVCVCVTHQNVKLMSSAAKPSYSCSEIIGSMVCSAEKQTCMFGQCQ